MTWEPLKVSDQVSAVMSMPQESNLEADEPGGCEAVITQSEEEERDLWVP